MSASLSVVFHHLRGNVGRVANRRCSAGPTVCAPTAASSTGSISVVRTWTVAAVVGDGFVDNRLLDFLISLRWLPGLAPRGGQNQEQSGRADGAFHRGSHFIPCRGPRGKGKPRPGPWHLDAARLLLLANAVSGPGESSVRLPPSFDELLPR